MNTRRLLPPLASLVLFCAGLNLHLAAADSGTGYRVVLDIKVDEKGKVDDAVVVSSEDSTVDHVLDLIAMEKARQMKPEVHQKDGHPVRYVIRAPFIFPIEGDEGADSNLAPRPSLHGKYEAQPVYPPELAAKGEVGAAILELTVGADGEIKDVTLLRATRPEFGDSAVAGVKLWHFSPAIRNGVPISSRSRLAIVFETDEAIPDWKWRLPPRPALGSYTVMHRTHPLPPEATAPAAPAGPHPEPAPAPGK